MVFSSTVFLFFFFPIVLAVYYVVRPRTLRNVVLLLASLGFYAWGEPVCVFLMLASILVTYVMGRLLSGGSRSRQKAVLIAAVAYHVGVLAVFKYLSFASEQLGLLLQRDWAISIALPIGISFYTFQMLSYLFDVYYGTAAVQKNVLKLALYVALFPQLVAGPIVRYNAIEEELSSRKETLADFSAGIMRFTYGLAKKTLLANYLAICADAVFEADERSVLAAWLGALCYTLQIYFDFSGYSDMAIGLGRCFGFHFSENFRYPYIAKSVTDFWRRWHISLSSWFRDYVYIPLGGSRTSRGKWVRNLFVVWLLTGIWHGANWTFVLWGLLYFAVLLAEKAVGVQRVEAHAVSHLYTMLVVMLAWVIFRADTLADAFVYLGNLFGVGANGVSDALFWEYGRQSITLLGVSLLLACPVVSYLQKKGSGRLQIAWNVCSSAVLFALSVLVCVKSTYQPFIYFNF